MKRTIAMILAAVAVIAVAAAIAVAVINRPLVTAPKGTAPLDNKMDLSAVEHLVADEAGVLTEETEKIIKIYNANWYALAGRCMAVVTVENTENAEDDAWEWAQRLSLGKNDALLLMETGGNKECAFVARGTFLEDIATLKEGYLERLTYMPVRAGEFDEAALAVCERMHYLYGYDGESHRKANVTEGVIVLAVIALFAVPFLLYQAAEKVDNLRFRRWYNRYGQLDTPSVPWRTAVLWHRKGTKWYQLRMNGEWVDYGRVIRRSQREVRARHMFRGR